MSVALVPRLLRAHPETAAAALEQAETADAVATLRELDPPLAGAVLEHMMPHVASAVLLAMDREASTALLLGMGDRAAARILQQFDDAQRAELLGALPAERAARLGTLASFPPESAAGMMHTRVATMRIDQDVGDTIAAIRRAPRDALHYLYVTDDDGRLQGVLLMRDLLLADPRTPVADILRRNLVTLDAAMTREQIGEVFREVPYAVLPVVDREGRLLGIVRHDAVLDAAREEAYEDMQRMVGAGAGERALDAPRVVVRRRLPWLVVNLATAFLASAVVGLFEATIAQVTALAVLLPIVAGQSGNSGAQTLAVVMRGIALGEVRDGVRARVVWKELLGGLVNGVAIAVVCAGAVLLWDGRPALAAVIGLAMICAMVMSTVAGTVIPIAIAASGRDPAQSATIFLTTVTDVVGFGAFLGFALLFMPWLVG